MAEREFSVIDLETTGFSPKKNDRVVEVAVTRVSEDGSAIGSFETLVNPERDVGATSVHGITAKMVKEAPHFRDIADHLVGFMENSVVVSHNASFDLRFLVNELSLAGIDVAEVAHICTLKLARRYLNDLPSKKLSSLCQYFDIQQKAEHSALSDAEATAELLLILARNYRALDSLDAVEPFVLKSRRQNSGSPRLVKRAGSAHSSAGHDSLLSKLHQRMPTTESGTEETLAYSELLHRVLLDRIVTNEESTALRELALELGLSSSQVLQAHRDYVRDLMRVAYIDGVLSQHERSDIQNVTQLLGLDTSAIEEIEAELEDDPTVTRMTDLAKQHQGKSVCFTGELQAKLNGKKISRSFAQRLAMERGLSVNKSVTKSLDYLVVADPESQSSKARRARDYGVTIVSEPAFWSMIGLQVE